jgi:osmotically-inducible protein OsmY
MRALSLLLILTLIVPLLVAQGTPTDDRIFDEVRRKLATDPDVRGAGFDVTVKNGVVTLKGMVHTKKAIEKAEKITKKVKDVVKVDNQLTEYGTDK